MNEQRGPADLHGTPRLFMVPLETLKAFKRDNCFLLSAAMSFYILLSLAPILVVVFAVLDSILARDLAQAGFLNQVELLLGETSAQTLFQILQRTRRSGGSGTAALFGGILLVFTATTAFVRLKDSLNVVWGANTRREGGTLVFLLKRLHSLLLLAIVAALLLVSLVFDSALVALFGGLFDADRGTLGAIIVVSCYIFSVLFDGVLFLFVFKILPDVPVPWSQAFAGAIVTSFLFQLGKFLIGLFLAHSRIDSLYGSAGALIVVLVWVYYASIIFFIGAEFTKAIRPRA